MTKKPRLTPKKRKKMLQLTRKVLNKLDKRSKKGSANHIAEAIVRLPGIELFAQATADDMYNAITKLTDKLKRQLDKHRKMQLDYQPMNILAT